MKNMKKFLVCKSNYFHVSELFVGRIIFFQSTVIFQNPLLCEAIDFITYKTCVLHFLIYFYVLSAVD